MNVLLGIDTGTYSTKGVACLADGTIVAEARANHGIEVPHPGFAEQDADLVWWADVCLVARRLMALVPQGSRVIGLATSGTGPCLVAVDDDGRPLRPAMLYGVDARSGGQIAELEARIGRSTIARLSGCRITSQYVGPKILWLKQNEPELYERTARFLTATSYVIYRFTGSYVVDRHQASYFAPFIDLKRGRWDLRYADGLIAENQLPQLRWSHEVVGRIHREASRETGLPEGTPIVMGSTDGLAEALSVGVVAPGDLMITYGSAAVLMLVLGGHRLAPNMWSSAGAFPGDYVLAGGPASSGSITSWFRRELARELPQTGTEAIGEAHAALVGEAEKSDVGARGLLMLPYFNGERSPLSDPDARGILAGLTLSHTRGDIYRAILEAAAFATRHTMEQMQSAGATISRAVAVGGGSVSELWVQIVSDVTGVAQEVPRCRIGASYGDAFLAGLATGAITDKAKLRDQWVQVSRRVEPDPEAHDRYDRFYGLYRSLYGQTRRTAHALAKLQGEPVISRVRAGQARPVGRQ